MKQYTAEELRNIGLDEIGGIQEAIGSELIELNPPSLDTLPPGLQETTMQFVSKMQSWTAEHLPSNDPDMVHTLSMALQDEYKELMIEGTLMAQERLRVLRNISGAN